MKRILGLFVIACILSAALAARPAAAQTASSTYIVTLKGANASPAAKLGIKTNHVYSSVLNGFAADLTPEQVAQLKADPSVAEIEADQEYTISATQYMDANGDPWGLDRIDQKFLPLSGSYTYNTTAPGVTAYIIDTGIAVTHPEFGGRAANVFNSAGGQADDCNGHGTHVAGIVGARTYGVAKAVKLRGVKVLNCAGSGTTAGIIAALDWVRANAAKPAVANMSLGGGFSSALNAAVTNLSNSGVFVAVAVGNSASNACNYSPASAAAAYAVAATDKTDKAAATSNYGSCVDIYAPGVGIKSTWLNGGAQVLTGSSMASPHAAGVAALYKASLGDASSATVTAWLNSNATPNVVVNAPPNTPNRLLYKGNF
ncbi:MAG TPA: S8 family peptidase [Herpetosiphonaceae bacterium]